MFTKTSLAVSMLAASSALAHFTLDYPATRGFDEDKEPDFCGGFITPANPPNPFPLSGGPIQFTSHHTLATTGLLIATVSNPQSFANFTTQANGKPMPFAESFFQASAVLQVSEGSHCFNVDLQSLGLNLTNGSTVTLQMQFNGGDGNLFQCTDVILLEGYTAPSNVTCTNDAATQASATVSTSASIGAASASGSATGSASAAASSSAPASGADRKMVAGGLIGGALALAGAVMAVL